MRNILIRVVVLLAVFIVSFSVVSRIYNRENLNTVTAMEPCSLPVITALSGEHQVNRLYGYCSDMSSCYMRNTVTPLDDEGKLTIKIDTYGTKLKGIGFDVRSLDTTRLVESSKVKEWDENQRVVDVKLNIQDLLEDNTEYILMIKLSTEEQKDIYYYTRIVKNADLFAQEKMAFVKDFHDKTFDKANGKELSKYLESNSGGDNSDFHYVNINSSYDQVTWGSMKVEQKSEPVIQIQELNNQTGIFILRYQVSMENDAKETECYNVEEYYRIRYTKDRTYLLDFNRTMEQVFKQENAVYYTTSIQLGISGNDIDYMTNKDETIVCFVQAGELFLYNKTDNKISKLFGFMESKEDVREQNDDHEIKIIKVNDEGDTDFIVYGYMNRGQHEGKVGVSVCHYDNKTNSVEEYLFIESEKPYQHLKEEVGQLAYIGDDNTLYIHLKGNIYQIHTNPFKMDTMIDNIKDGTLVASADNKYIAWQKEQNVFDSSTVILMNLETGEKKEISAGSDERIRPLGFMGSDFIYGLANTSYITAGADGRTVFAMHKIIIQNEKGEVLKQYDPSGFYVTDVTVVENMIRLTRVTDNSNNRNFVAASEDQIVNSQEEDDNVISITSTVTEKKKREYQISFGTDLKNGNPKRLYPKEIISENSNEIKSPEIKEDDTRYYVYAKGKMDSMYTSAVQAIAIASDKAGVVVTANQNCIWERTKSLTKTQIMDVNTVGTAENMNSTAACLTSILSRSGIQADVNGLLAQGQNVETILDDQLGKENVINLSGTSLDNVLYCINKGYPVIAKSDSNNYVIIVGYNELNTIVMDPVNNKTGYVGMNDSRAMFEAAGNEYYAITK